LRSRGWPDLVISTQTPAWKGSIATACTCRPDHFEHRLKSSTDLQGGIEISHVGAFDDAEPGALLRKRGLTREGLPPALVELMRKPRLSTLATEQTAALSGGGEVTAERLVYKDWRHRHPGAQRVLCHDEFKVLVTNLDRTTAVGLDQAPLSRIELFDSLSFEVELKISPPQQFCRLRSRLPVAADRRDVSLALEDATLQSSLEAMLAFLDPLSIDSAHDPARREA
jgi:hypothetical protein